MILARAAFLAAALFVAAAAAIAPARGGTAGDTRFALVVSIDGPIGPATARYVRDGLATAAERGAVVVILRLDTPGGLVASMREIIAAVLASPVPVVGYVAPSGAHAASAGTYILYATHVAAMAPGTNLGAATPVSLGGPLPGLPGGGSGKDEKDGPTGDAMTAKMTNDAAAFIRSLAELRRRNADWAEKAVREAASLSADAALQAHVVDLVAVDTHDLLDRIDGRTVEVAGGPRRLSTRGATVDAVEPDWLTRLLSVITDPNVALVLMLVGIYGLIFEFSSPGAVAPGVVGTICLLLGLYAFNMLPTDYAGMALMLLGAVFLAVEAYSPTVVLGLGGVAAFLLGAAMLLRNGEPGYQLSWTVVGPVAALLLGLSLLTGHQLRKARRTPVRVGAPAMLGLPVRILDWTDDRGHVLAEGERWLATGNEAFRPGDTVEVADVDGLTLAVRRQAPSSGS